MSAPLKDRLKLIECFAECSNEFCKSERSGCDDSHLHATGVVRAHRGTVRSVPQATTGTTDKVVGRLLVNEVAHSNFRLALGTFGDKTIE